MKFPTLMTVLHFYSHSLCVCGFVQFLVTILVVFLVQGEPGTKQEYGELLLIFGCIMAMAAIPIFGILGPIQ